MTLGKRIDKEEYYKYQYICPTDWGAKTPNDLDYNKQYFALKVDKNRGGNKHRMPVFEINLDYNIWNEVGYLVKKKKRDGE